VERALRRKLRVRRHGIEPAAGKDRVLTALLHNLHLAAPAQRGARRAICRSFDPGGEGRARRRGRAPRSAGPARLSFPAQPRPPAGAVAGVPAEHEPASPASARRSATRPQGLLGRQLVDTTTVDVEINRFTPASGCSICPCSNRASRSGRPAMLAVIAPILGSRSHSFTAPLYPPDVWMYQSRRPTTTDETPRRRVPATPWPNPRPW